MSEKMFSMSQAAQEIGCSYSTVRLWRNTGKLGDDVQTVMVGNMSVIMIPASTVERLKIEFQKRRNGRKGA